MLSITELGVDSMQLDVEIIDGKSLEDFKKSSLAKEYCGKHKLVLIRGLSGSGKSTLAKHFMYHNYIVFEADDYFTDDFGNYSVDLAKLQNAHNECFKNTTEAIMNGDFVVVANTFSKLAHIENYITFAKKNNISYQVFTLIRGLASEIPNFKLFPSIHNVPDNTIRRMMEFWEPIAGEIFVRVD